MPLRRFIVICLPNETKSNMKIIFAAEIALKPCFFKPFYIMLKSVFKSLLNLLLQSLIFTPFDIICHITNYIIFKLIKSINNTKKHNLHINLLIKVSNFVIIN
jgi:hypothetical protein